MGEGSGDLRGAARGLGRGARDPRRRDPRKSAPDHGDALRPRGNGERPGSNGRVGVTDCKHVKAQAKLRDGPTIVAPEENQAKTLGNLHASKAKPPGLPPAADQPPRRTGCIRNPRRCRRASRKRRVADREARRPTASRAASTRSTRGRSSRCTSSSRRAAPRSPRSPASPTISRWPSPPRRCASWRPSRARRASASSCRTTCGRPVYLRELLEDERWRAAERRAAGRARQGHRRAARLRRPREDAPRARRRRDGAGKSVGAQRDADLAPRRSGRRRRCAC